MMKLRDTNQIKRRANKSNYIWLLIILLLLLAGLFLYWYLQPPPLEPLSFEQRADKKSAFTVVKNHLQPPGLHSWPPGDFETFRWKESGMK